MVGGRTNHWGRISLRFGPYDFKRKSRDGLGDDWPISYEDVAPYYDKIDRLIGVFGSKENLPNEPDGVFQPPPRPRCHELLVKQAADKLHVTCIPSRLSILTRPLNGRAPCHYCGQCNRGCRVNANFTSTNVLIGPALTTGRLTLVTNAMAREVTVDKTGRASGVAYVDKTTGADRHVSAKVVVLAASALETARLLLNSKSSAFPNGLANGSGTVGKYITDTTGTDVGGFIPKMMDHVPHNHDGVGGMHLYMPWWLEDRTLDFPRGYHIEVWGGTHVPDSGIMGGIQRYPAGGGYGKQLKDDYRRYYGATIGFSGRGEMIPNDDTYCEIDPRTVDRWGIPVLRFHWKWSDHEYNQVKHMQETFRAIIAELGGEVFSPMPTRERGYGIAAGGVIIHELGGARMGDDPKTSVTNGWCRAHESVREAAALARETLQRGVPYEPQQFTAHEWETVRLLVDLILPKDEHSGSATEAGVPEFMDFMLGDDPNLATPIKGGLAWLDHECDDRYGKTFTGATDGERTAVLDDIAWPKKAKPEHAAGAAFFNGFRDLTATGFFSSKLGVQDLRYIGNTFVAEWKGCPPEALAKLGVSYAD